MAAVLMRANGQPGEDDDDGDLPPPALSHFLAPLQFAALASQDRQTGAREGSWGREWMVRCAADMEAGHQGAEGGALAPRYFCRACRRYWTRGGALRNVPVGGGTRKATPATRRKRPASTPPEPAPPAAGVALPPLTVSGPHGALLRQYGLPFPAPTLASPLAAMDPDHRLLDLGGSFSSLIASAPGPDVVGGHFSAGFLAGGLAPALAHVPGGGGAAAATHPPPPPPQPQQQQLSQALPEGLLWSMGWPDLSI
ncbi:dof zinc finger protein DOF1.7 [Panicum miliaceum]|uniref:Dof zinc finger protein n=1 Tax=Panicum miliaceum TaxID=4540 RepID=A0A3L6SST5_PANMI|nr:dof zinc finger protein DOF1.7 [Panicum miliaceum]